MHASRCWTTELAPNTLLLPIGTDCEASLFGGVSQVEVGRISAQNCLVVTWARDVVRLDVSEDGKFAAGRTTTVFIPVSSAPMRFLLSKDAFVRLYLLNDQPYSYWVEEVRFAQEESER